jgi:hypothetical protein
MLRVKAHHEQELLDAILDLDGHVRGSGKADTESL